MELWIRSQDKEVLMKTTELRYNQKKEDYSILAYDTRGDYRLLGIYKNKKRALELLDEIEKLLKPQIKIINNKIVERENLMNNNFELMLNPIIEEIKIQQFDTWVYQMPEE